MKKLLKRAVWLFSIPVFLIFSCSNSERSNAPADESMSKMAEAADVQKSMVDVEKTNVDKDKDATSQASSKTWKRSDKNANSFELFIGDTEKIPLKGSQIYIKIDGFRARVLMDCFFWNDKEWQTEGTFKLRLPNEASPFYFAFGETVYLDKDQKQIPFINYDKQKEITFSPEQIKQIRGEAWVGTKEAKVVPKEKAALAYTQTVNRRVDPALMEWSGAGIFDCRVFPLQPQKLHRIVVGYDINLTSINQDKVLDFMIPKTEAPINLDFDIATVNSSKLEITPEQNHQDKANRKLIHLENPEIELLSVRYKNFQNVMLISSEDAEDKYFAGTFKINLQQTANAQISENAIIMLDVSLSSNPDKFNVWLKMAEALLKNNQDQIKNFAVQFFNIESFWWQNQFVPNTEQNIKSLMEYCKSIVLQGATDLSFALEKASKPEWLSDNMAKNIFLLSDGNITWGEPDVFQIVSKISRTDKVFAWNTGMSGTELSVLEQVTRETGGAVFSVTGEDEIAYASKAYRNLPWKITGIEIKNAEDFLIQGRPEYMFNGQNILITGRSSTEKLGNIQINLQQGNSKKTLTINFNQTIQTPLAERIYGQLATNQLEEFGFYTEKYAIAYATHYQIPGKNCSFLMLESQEDYQQYNIKPEENLFVIKNNPARKIISDILTEVKTYLGDAKKSFENWLKKLTLTPGLTFEIPATFESLLKNLTSLDFTISQNGLKGSYHTKNEYSSDILNPLQENTLDYDIISKNSIGLKKTSVPDAIKYLSSLVEKNQGDGVLYRDIAFSAMEWNLFDQSFYILKNVINRRPYEPQTYHAIAQSLVKMHKIELAILYYEIAIQAQWDARFGEFRYIVALDYIKLLREIKNKKYSVKFADYINPRLENLQKEFAQTDYDLMITIMWNTDFTDIDLHVIEPTGEECFYSHPETKIGGKLTRDVTQGYGPEMYVLEKAKQGKYKISVNYFSSNRNRASARTKVYATVYQNWGKPNEHVETKTINLIEGKERLEVMEIDIRK